MLSREWRKLPEKMFFSKRKKKLELKFNPGLALIGLRTTGPRILNTKEIVKNRA